MVYHFLDPIVRERELDGHTMQEVVHVTHDGEALLQQYMKQESPMDDQEGIVKISVIDQNWPSRGGSLPIDKTKSDLINMKSHDANTKLGSHLKDSEWSPKLELFNQYQFFNELKWFAHTT